MIKAARIILLAMALCLPGNLAGLGLAQTPGPSKNLQELKKDLKEKRRAWLRYQLDEEGPGGGNLNKVKAYNEAKAKALKEYKDSKAAVRKAKAEAKDTAITN